MNTQDDTLPEGCNPDHCSSCSVADCPSHSHAGSEFDGPHHESPNADSTKLSERLGRIQKKIIVMSGKGGVGKSTVAVNLAMAAMTTGRRVGLLDVDLHGPSVPTMLGLEGQQLLGDENGMRPIQMGGLNVMSVGFLLEDPDTPVVWRGPVKMGAIRQFIEEVQWGDLDLLVIDVPPGTGDEPLSICQLIPDLEGAVIVTTPQKVAAVDVRKSITFCKSLGVPVLGVVENMSGFVCPHCGQTTPILREGGGRTLAQEMGVPFLGSIPMDPRIALSGDEGNAFVLEQESSPTSKAFHEIVTAILAP